MSVRELGAAITARASTVASTARVQSRTEKATTNIGERKKVELTPSNRNG